MASIGLLRSNLGGGTARFINARRIFLRTAAILRHRLSMVNSRLRITDFAPKPKSQTHTNFSEYEFPKSESQIKV